jgi:hypothetical protein
MSLSVRSMASLSYKTRVSKSLPRRIYSLEEGGEMKLQVVGERLTRAAPMFSIAEILWPRFYKN